MTEVIVESSVVEFMLWLILFNTGVLSFIALPVLFALFLAEGVRRKREFRIDENERKARQLFENI